MSKPVILCIDDQRDVLAALSKDLDHFALQFDVVEAESADEAQEVLDDLDATGQPVALIISDHVMPGGTGVDLLSKIAAGPRFQQTRKLLLTGLATHADTIRAINEAKIDQYIAKPWDVAELHAAVARLVTHFIFDAMPDDHRKYLDILDKQVVLARMSGNE